MIKNALRFSVLSAVCASITAVGISYGSHSVVKPAMQKNEANTSCTPKIPPQKTTIPISWASTKLISPDEKLALRFEEKNLVLFETSKPANEQILGENYSFSASFSPNAQGNKLLAIGKYDGQVSIFELNSTAQKTRNLITFQACQGEVFSTALSEEEHLLVQCGTNQLAAYQVDGNKKPTPIKINNNTFAAPLVGIAISGSGKYIAFSDSLGSIGTYQLRKNSEYEIKQALRTPLVNVDDITSHLLFAKDEDILLGVPKNETMITVRSISNPHQIKTLYTKPKSYSFSLRLHKNKLIGYGLASGKTGIEPFKISVDSSVVSECFSD